MNIFIDFFGTLVNTVDSSVIATGQILERLGITLPATKVYSKWKKLNVHLCNGPFETEAVIFRKGLNITLDLFGYPGIDTDVPEMLTAICSRKPFPDSLDFLRRVSSELPVTVASNSDREPLMACMEPFSLYVDECLTSEDLECYKPQASFYEGLLSRRQVAAVDAIYIGDSLINDYHAPRENGIAAYLIERGTTFIGTKRGHRFRSLADCADFIIANKAVNPTR